ncbi:AAA-ATPase At3g28580-like isoform X1 [Vicia villosa]|uniref:AAA-ATPase At3g28580-like isoform X1 n=1 Tax=Vicia villosa TaxID=3911 RepID=UPI00273BDF12|nr:AAA-ATPase At3g28580-like isoform X1 [Vicia villosa]XP_058725287.1 AAA-ATPase At3g28580-like isoform X1 [Vicia villosa]XP_058725288.1 AAA-ATPase At3g28580-like isoform X1 [Vicia villosa]XP_058725289.1 AAA-ATPase At3g28580-like isoform X1 [Vicia villosa]XP_058725290.1 AAA-ATPase At3g28580-like isoform X1 [Vicia villosa]XP_058725291.1 AAA-ATPase At3g28580-like isoform X1 [Vicia villosa]XP_058725292.1 AAA-ATPase At3g28580-like isoform X1 [Vicia villosa]XP_058725293.1 AAA-ATPase At3g28580-lik
MWAMIQRYCPHQVHSLIEKFSQKLANFFYPYVEVKFFEYIGDYYRTNEAFTFIEHYLHSKPTNQAKKLRGESLRKSLVLKMDERQEFHDEFEGINVVWSLRKIVPSTKSVSFYPADDKRYYLLTFHRGNRDFVVGTYLNHVLEHGEDIGLSKRQRRLYTNCTSGDSDMRGKWSHVIFDHPSSFETIAMDGKKKKEIVDDLVTFSKGKDYYARIGKPWKRGYLLYGPPGTGKSSLVAAIANFLKYDIYDIELTNVKTNAELRKLLIGITSKSVVVIEDIDCSLDLTGQRKTDSENENEEDEKNEKNEVNQVVAASMSQLKDEANKNKRSSQVTLSGLLNFIDGIWSASTGERLIIFTTNYVEKLDKALIRRGRMDMHIELSYCCFEGFKMLAMNYMSVETHPLFETVRGLLEESNISPADVAENLMPKVANEEVETSLERLIQALRSSKEEAKKKAEKAEESTGEGEDSAQDKKSLLEDEEEIDNGKS